MSNEITITVLLSVWQDTRDRWRRYADLLSMKDREITKQRERADNCQRVLELWGILYNTPPLITSEQEWNELQKEAIQQTVALLISSEPVELTKQNETPKQNPNQKPHSDSPTDSD